MYVNEPCGLINPTVGFSSGIDTIRVGHGYASSEPAALDSS